ncbi:hypothetical protein ACFX13_019282 [Malus domestica]
MMHYVEDDNDSHTPTPTFRELIIPEILVASKVTNPSKPQVPPQASVEVSGTISLPPIGKEDLSSQSQKITPPPLLSKAPGLSQDPGEGSDKSPPRLVHKGDLPHFSSVFEVTGASIPCPEQRAKTAATTSPTSTLSFENLPILPSKVVPVVATESVRDMPPASSTTSLLDLVKKFGQIKNKLQSPPTISELPLFQRARKLFKDWRKKGFTASFSLKVLYDVETSPF